MVVIIFFESKTINSPHFITHPTKNMIVFTLMAYVLFIIQVAATKYLFTSFTIIEWHFCTPSFFLILRGQKPKGNFENPDNFLSNFYALIIDMHSIYSYKKVTDSDSFVGHLTFFKIIRYRYIRMPIYMDFIFSKNNKKEFIVAFYIHLGMIVDGNDVSNNLLDVMIHQSRITFEYRLRLLSELFGM